MNLLQAKKETLVRISKIHELLEIVSKNLETAEDTINSCRDPAKFYRFRKSLEMLIEVVDDCMNHVKNGNQDSKIQTLNLQEIANSIENRVDEHLKYYYDVDNE